MYELVFFAGVPDRRITFTNIRVVAAPFSAITIIGSYRIGNKIKSWQDWSKISVLAIASVYHGNHDGSAALGHIPRKRLVGPTSIGAAGAKKFH